MLRRVPASAITVAYRVVLQSYRGKNRTRDDWNIRQFAIDQRRSPRAVRRAAAIVRRMGRCNDAFRVLNG